MSLKRLLVGSISLSEDSHLDEENGGEASERKEQESEGCQSTGIFPLISFCQIRLFVLSFNKHRDFSCK